jgi:hypothetical protein
MLFSEQDAPQLKKWIVKRLENTYVLEFQVSNAPNKEILD